MLLLFDIDGTLLLKASAAHRAALHDALIEVFGLHDADESGVEVAGRTDTSIARDILLRSGIAAREIDDGMAALCETWRVSYALRCPEDLSDRVAPGITDLLDRLSGRPGVRLSLVTGNLEAIARVKLRHAGLGDFFEDGQGGFGSDDEDRVELPPLARRRAGRGGDPYPREQTLVIGDTPRDIACAHADGLRCVAVATGPFGVEDLAQADVVVADGHELGAALDRLL